MNSYVHPASSIWIDSGSPETPIPGETRVDSQVASIAGPSESPVVVDIGGEGRHPQAWNVNPSLLKTLGPDRGQPIPRHILGRAEAIPLPSGSVDIVIVERTPLRLAALREIARVASAHGRIILRHASLPDRDCHELPKRVLPGLVAQQFVNLGGQRVQESVFEPSRLSERA